MFFLPIADDNPTRRRPVVTILLIVTCIAVYLWQAQLGTRAGNAAVYSFGMIPSVLVGTDHLPPALVRIPAWASVITSMFLHGGYLHVGGNMLYLWIFGNNVEDSMGRGRFLVFYFVCGIAAALTQVVADPSSEVPMVGASGAIAGVLGAYLVLHPRANVRVFMWLIIIIRIINVPAAIVLGLWFAGQVFSGVTTPAGNGGVAFWAHIGGFVAGVVLIPLFKNRQVMLFEPPRSRAFISVVSRGSVPSAGGRPWR